MWEIFFGLNHFPAQTRRRPSKGLIHGCRAGPDAERPDKTHKALAPTEVTRIVIFSTWRDMFCIYE
jgi:hypothetical protein